MTFRGVALRRLYGLTRIVTNDVATSRTAQHRGRRALARVLAVRETHLTAAGGAAPSWFALDRRVGGHHSKRTASGAQEAGSR